MTKKVRHPVPDDVVQRFVRNIHTYDGWTVIGYDAETILDAVTIKSTYSFYFWDALLVATMKQHAIGTIYTEDAHFTKIPG